MSVKVDRTHLTVRENSPIVRTTSEKSFFFPLDPNRTLTWFHNLPRETQQQWKEHLNLEQKTTQTWEITTKRCLTPSPTGEPIKKHKTHNQALISKQSVLRKYCWRVVCLHGQPSLCMVQEINDFVTVKILDARLPVDQWPQYQVHPKQLYLTSITTSETLDDLIFNLRKSQILHSSSVDKGLRQIDRKNFCPQNPYHDCAVDIGNPEYGVCISSPHMHVWAAELLIKHLPNAKYCLDVGSGSGYFTALMAFLAPKATVCGVEYYTDLAQESKNTVQKYYPQLADRIIFSSGDGERGINDKNVLFDAIHIGFMCLEPPPQLVEQLAPGGRMLVPVALGTPSTFDTRCFGGYYTCVDKDFSGKIKITKLFTCSFVPSIALSQAEDNQ